MPVDTQGISCCFDEESSRMLEDYEKEGLSDTALAILSSMKQRGLPGSSVLELGCGFGALALELLKNGAATARGVDLSPKMIETARILATREGRSSDATFTVGDGATSMLPQSDIVVLDTVICCYPDFEALLKNSSSAVRKFYAISLPDDRRLLTRFLKVFLPLQGIFIRRRGFRFFVHPMSKVLARLTGAGFELIDDAPAGRIWSVLVFSAPRSRA